MLMQPDDPSVSLAAIKHLTLTGELLFDLFFDGPNLRPVLFGSYSNMTYDRNYHFFVSEVACGRLDIDVY